MRRVKPPERPPAELDRRLVSIRMGLAAVLIAYWLCMFAGTHMPRVPRVLAERSDKLLHAIAYGGLSVLLLTCWICRKPITFRSVTRLWLLIGCYAAFDEITQPLVGRRADFADWIADVTGATIGLAVTWFIAIRFFARRLTLNRST